MNKPTALLLFLWDPTALLAYLRSNPRTVFLLPGAGDGIVQALEAVGSQVKKLEMVLDQPLLQQANATVAAAMQSLQSHGISDDLPHAFDSQAVLEVYGDTLTQHVPTIFALLGALQRIESDYFIEAVLLNEESLWASKTIARWAKQQGIPSIHLSHGTGISKNYNFERYCCDTVAVFSERSAEYYLDSGVPPDCIEVIGNRNWNQYAGLKQQKPLARQTLCERTGLDPALPIIVFGTTWNAYLSLLDERDLAKELHDFFSIYRPLTEQGFQPQLVVKDRRLTGKGAQDNRNLVFDIAQRFDIPAERVRYEFADVQLWVAGSDVVVSIDSNLSVEATLAETPAVNLMTPFGMLVGPGFGPEDPVLQCEPTGLADVVGQILESSELRESLQLRMRRHAERFNRGIDGKAEDRLCELLTRKRRISIAGGGDSVWQRLRHGSGSGEYEYRNGPCSEVVDFALREPRRVLDLTGTSAKYREYIEQKHPQAQVYSLAPNHRAEQFERMFAEQGITPASLDTVMVADVLAQIHDPWSVLAGLRPYFAPDVQLLARIPNIRNLMLMNNLAEGEWRYESSGLLDVANIRFYTLKEIYRLFREAGFKVAKINCKLDPRLTEFYAQNQGAAACDLEFGRISLKNIGQSELIELCTLQFLVGAEFGA